MWRFGVIVVVLSILFMSYSWASSRYAKQLCKRSDYTCIKTKRGDTWYNLWPDEEERDIVKRVNRINHHLYAGLTIAVPNNLADLTIYDVAPFPRYIDPIGEKSIFVSQQQLAWGAYDKQGELLWWGPISTGRDFCEDVGEACNTPGGEFRILRKQDIDCVSTQFPRRPNGEHGGAAMPYCMHFFRGYALHGSDFVPGYRDSHGCVRLFTEDAKWLNEEFINVPGHGRQGTKVIIEGLPLQDQQAAYDF